MLGEFAAVWWVLLESCLVWTAVSLSAALFTLPSDFLQISVCPCVHDLKLYLVRVCPFAPPWMYGTEQAIDLCFDLFVLEFSLWGSVSSGRSFVCVFYLQLDSAASFTCHGYNTKCNSIGFKRMVCHQICSAPQSPALICNALVTECLAAKRFTI